MSTAAPSELAVIAPVATARILIVDDEAAIRESLQLLFQMEAGFEVFTAADARDGWERFQSAIFDLVLLDVALPGGSGAVGGLDLLRRIRSESSVPVIMISAYATVELAVQAMQWGAQTFLQKPWNNEKLLADVRSAIAAGRMSQENLQLKRALKQRYGLDNIVGKSEAMLRVLDWIMQAAPSRATVLLQGESGTGKDLVAKAIHAYSPRAEFPFVPVNLGNLPPAMLEATLFGQVKGAFPGAGAPRKGLFEAAHKGTIFFDEIGSLSLDTQAKILSVLEDMRFMRVGSVEEIQVDVRVIAATNGNLRAKVAEGSFREDLYYRLNVLGLRLPPLRERREDIPLLADHFLARYAAENGVPARRLSPEALRCLFDYPWPGHVRELENAIERAVVLSTETVIGPEILPEAIRGTSGAGAGRESGGGREEERAAQSLFAIVDDFERRLILDMLEQTRGRQTEAAERFRIPVSTLNQKIKRFGIDVKKVGSREAERG